LLNYHYQEHELLHGPAPHSACCGNLASFCQTLSSLSTTNWPARWTQGRKKPTKPNSSRGGEPGQARPSQWKIYKHCNHGLNIAKTRASCSHCTAILTPKVS